MIPVRLALFAEMVKNRPWVPSTLRELGGSQGVGVAFLEEAFGPGAPPLRRYYANAVREVLSRLLPDKGADIKGNLRSRNELMEACGLAGRSRNFEDVLHILDTELRLITPAEFELPAAVPGGERRAAADPYFQLTHDYLVQPVRRWLTSKQRRTRRGRAELRLDELATDWRQKPETRNLPSLWEFLSVNVLTHRADWSATQRDLLRHATRFYAVRSVAILAVLALALFLGSRYRGRASARDLFDQLLVARTSDVPRIVEQMRDERQWVLPLLQNPATVLGRVPDARERLNLSLALLPDDSTQVDFLTQSMSHVNVSDLPIIFDTLLPYREACRTQIWNDLENSDDPASSLALAAAVAAFDPHSPNWRDVAPRVANALVTTNPLQLAEWLALLSPVAAVLTGPLVDVYTDAAREDAAERNLARIALQEFAGENTAQVVRMMVNCIDKDFPALLSLLEANAVEAVPLLTVECIRPPTALYVASPGDWPVPSASAVQQIEAAGGFVHAGFAICPHLPLTQLQPLLLDLQQAAFRPICFRPYRGHDDGLRVAAVWTRDGRRSEWLLDATLDQLQQRDEQLQAAGLLPVDVCGYVREGERYAAVWTEPSSRGDRAEIYAGLSNQDPRAGNDAWVSHGLRPTRRQIFLDEQGRLRHCMVWGINAYDTEESYHWQGHRVGLKRLFAVRPFPLDVSAMVQSPVPTDQDPVRLTCLWRRNGKRTEAQLVMADSQDEHDRRSRELADLGYHPVSITCVDVPAQPSCFVSVWHRPLVSDAAHDAYLLRRAKAAAALLQLGHAERVLPLLRFGAEPDLRSLLIHTLARSQCALEILSEHLYRETDAGIRQGLLLALLDLDASQMSSDLRSQLIAVLRTWYQSDPHSGMHAVIASCLKQWGVEDTLPLAEFPQGPPGLANQSWWHANPDECFALIDVTQASEPFVMGCPESEVEYGWFERLHLKNLKRRYAIGMREVTVQQFREFLAANPDVDHALTEEEHAEMPQTRVTWYLAAQYCNWRSEMAGIPPDEWCFRPNADGLYADGMSLAPDYLKKTGYRLPTETEWEYACRAGTTTARFFGRTPRLLSQYAWYSDNSQNHVHDVATLKPNPFGLYDVFGNCARMVFRTISQQIRRR